jgi:hypothetical protein
VAEWLVYTADDTLTRTGIVDDVVAGELRKRWNAPGAWVVEIDADNPAAALFADPGARVEFTRDGTTVMAGPVSALRRVRTASPPRSSVIVSGADDLGLLWERVAHPQPLTASPPWSTDAEDVQTGTLSTVLMTYVDRNAGATAVAARQIPLLTFDGDPMAGTSVTMRARFQTLGDLVAEAAAEEDLRLDVSLVPGSALMFGVYATVDRTAEVQFSEAFGNLAGYDYQLQAPTGTTLYVGGQGEGTARDFRIVTDSAAETAWRRIEALVDRRDLSVSGELDKAGAQALVERAARTSLSITPIETESLAWPVDYQVGDLVAVVVDGGRITDRVTEVVIVLDRFGGRATATVGALRPAGIASLFARLRATGRRLGQLERR